MDDVEITLRRHIPGDFDSVLGQLCMRCGMVLHDGASREAGTPEPEVGWLPGEAIMVSTDDAARFRVVESALREDRDRSDEADCASIA